VTAADPRLAGAWRRVVIPMEPVDPDLVKAVREGTYVVDPQLVAGAILRRHAQRADADRLAGVLEALERDGGSVGGPEDDAGAGPHVA
jgi:hypothetical protein